MGYGSFVPGMTLVFFDEITYLPLYMAMRHFIGSHSETCFD